MINDGRKSSAADSAEVGNGESPALHLFRRQFFLAGFYRKLGELSGEFDDVFLVDVTDDGHQQAAIRIDGDADVDVLLVDDFLFRHVDTGVELREYFERRGADFEGDGGDRHFAPGFLRFGSKTGAQLFELGDVSFILLGNVRDRGPRLPQVFRGFAADATDGNALDFSPLGEVREFGLGELRSARG